MKIIKISLGILHVHTYLNINITLYIEILIEALAQARL